METLILGALEEEIAGILAEMENVREEKAGPFAIHCGVLRGQRVLLCRCGVGKTNAAAAASAILATHPSVGCVLNTGVAGGIGGGLRRGDVALGAHTVHHDYDQTPDGLRKGQVQGFDSEYFAADAGVLKDMRQALEAEKIDFRVGTIASGDQFIADNTVAARIHTEFDAIACDFESAPIAQVCALYGVPFLAVRAVSDDGGNGAVMSFYEFLHVAAQKNVRAICRFLQLRSAAK